eukprot:scaffold655_cov105-Isochrysis_galbana.AAC.10
MAPRGLGGLRSVRIIVACGCGAGSSAAAIRYAYSCLLIVSCDRGYGTRIAPRRYARAPDGARDGVATGSRPRGAWLGLDSTFCNMLFLGMGRAMWHALLYPTPTLPLTRRHAIIIPHMSTSTSRPPTTHHSTTHEPRTTHLLRSNTRKFHRACVNTLTSKLPLPRYSKDQRSPSAPRGSSGADGPCCNAKRAALAGRAMPTGSSRRNAVRRNPRWTISSTTGPLTHELK